jgi:hypothetical protein
MRSTYRSVLVALMAVLAFSAVVAGSALAALPEFTGPFPIGLSETTVGEPVFKTRAGAAMEKCTAGGGQGELTSAKAIAVSTGKLLMGEPNGELGYIAKPKVGIKLTPKGGGNFPELAECRDGSLSLKVKARGAFICSIEPVNVKTTKFTISCSQAMGVQNPLTFEGGPKNSFLETTGFAPLLGEAWPWEQSGIAAEVHMVTEKTTEIIG